MSKPRLYAFLRTLRWVPGIFLASLILVACASDPVAPTQSLKDAGDAIASAEQAEARQYSAAELEEARQQLAAAEQAVTDKKMTEAEYLALQARVSAELAIAKTEAAKAVEINREMERGARALEEEMQRKGAQQ